jgi:DNA-binding LytR/AlgR family response regulator
MDLLLIEDEPLAMERLAEGVRAWDPAVRIVARLGSVAASLGWLRTHRTPDLALVDVQLSDGLSLELLRAPELRCPVIMVTAYDEYVLEALQDSCIDYLLKPVKQERLARALDKYLRLRGHFAGESASAARPPAPGAARPHARVLVRKGAEFLSLPLSSVAYFFTEDKLVFVRERGGSQHLVDRPLAELEAELDPGVFFRLNRRYLAHVEAIRRFRPQESGKLLVSLEPASAGPVTVSEERAGRFRDWMGRR